MPATPQLWNRMAIPGNIFHWKKKITEKEINLTPPNRISNTDWCKCKYKCKPVMTVAMTVNLLRLKS